jgi:starch-binding outer membrane protein, SusD/RagB family
MKKIIYFTMLTGLALAAGSCKKNFVTLYPEGQVNEGNFYKTTSDFQEALVGAYAPLRDAANVAFYLEEMRSDNTFFDYNSKDRGGSDAEKVSEFLDDASSGSIVAIWTADFLGIQRANIILDKIGTKPADMTDSVKNRIVGEAEGLRAHYYFELVRLYGALPLYLHEVTNSQNALLPRSPVETVYAQIIADLTDALGKLPPPTSFPQPGNITKGMVATELGLVYLTLKQYDKATPLLQSVTQMGYDLLPNYADVFKPANKNSKESIFEVQYKSGTDGQASSFIYDFIPVTPHTQNILGVDYSNTAGGWNIPTKDLIGAYDSGDARLDASIGLIKGKLNASVDFIPDSVVSILTKDTSGESTGEISRRFIKKQFHPPYTLQNNTDDDWPVYRYADVLLMLAESLNEQGQPGAALPYLNKVRQRAGLASSNVTDPATLRTIIAHERRVELAFENHRWFDLVRTGQAIPVMTAYGVKQIQAFPFLLPNSYNVTQNKLIYAVPNREVMVNPALGQNPGY